MALVVKSLPANAGDTRDEGSIPRPETSPEEGMATHPRESYGQRSLAGCNHRAAKSQARLKQLSMHAAETMSR